MTKRYFQCDNGLAISVPSGENPADYGVDVSTSTEIDRLPKYHETIINDKWEMNLQTRAKADEDMKFRAMSRGDMARFFINEIEALKSRVAVLEAA